MRDQSYFIFLGLVIVFLLDYFLLDAFFLKIIGRFVLNTANWMVGFVT